MNYCFLSPHFPPNFSNFAFFLHQKGVKVYGIADAPYDQLSPTLKASLTEYYRVESMDDYDQMVRALGYITHRGGKIDRLESHNEYWLETEAALRTDFNIYGIKNDTIERIKKKSVMKQVFIDAGVAVAGGALVEDLAQCEAFIAKVGYPVIAKPDIGVGALKTYKIHNKDELQQFFASKPPIPYFMEAFVQGQIVSFDGLTDRAGKVVFSAAHVFSRGVMETVNEDLDIYYYSLRELPEDLVEAGHRLIKAFGLTERFFHIEFFRTPSGGLVALEVNMRPPGGLTTDMFNFANDINIYEEYANVVARGVFEGEVLRPYHCAYVGQKFTKTYRHSHEEIMGLFGDKIVHQQPIAGVFSSALGNYGFLIRSENLEEVINMAEFIQEIK
ncbi:carboxylate--amine ligase [Myxococcota bacterium]|nr:carboxylate--amine ligase [Myxococcota bacterium]